MVLEQKVSGFVKRVFTHIHSGQRKKLSPQIRRFMARVLDEDGNTSVDRILETAPNGAKCPDLCGRIKGSTLVVGSDSTRAAIHACKNLQHIVALLWLGRNETAVATQDGVPPAFFRSRGASDDSFDSELLAAADAHERVEASSAMGAQPAAAMLPPPLRRSGADDGVDDELLAAASGMPPL